MFDGIFCLPAIMKIALRTNAGAIGETCVDTDQMLGQIKEHASQEGERSTIGVERASPTSVDTQMQHIWSQLLANSSGMQRQTLQNDCYVVTYCKSPLSLQPIS